LVINLYTRKKLSINILEVAAKRKNITASARNFEQNICRLVYNKNAARSNAVPADIIMLSSPHACVAPPVEAAGVLAVVADTVEDDPDEPEDVDAPEVEEEPEAELDAELDAEPEVVEEDELPAAKIPP
jgi:hypothetical protein